MQTFIIKGIEKVGERCGHLLKREGERKRVRES